MPQLKRQITYVCEVTLHTGRTFTKTYLTSAGTRFDEVLASVFKLNPDASVVKIKEILERRPEKNERDF